MTFAVAIGWSFLRSLLIAFCGVFIAKQISQLLDRRSHSRFIAIYWGAVMLPFFTPSLMTGFCYRDTAMSLIHTPLLKEVLYGLIVTIQLVPVAVILLKFAPAPAVSDSALAIARRTILSRSTYFKLLLRSRFQFDLIAGCMLFLLAFQEAELASLMQAASWTEWLFTRHARGLLLSESLRLIVIPMLIQVPCLLPLLLWLKTDQSNPDKDARLGETKTVPEGRMREQSLDSISSNHTQAKNRHNLTQESKPPSPFKASPPHLSCRTSSPPRGRRMLLSTLPLTWISFALITVTLIPSWQLLQGALRGSAGISNQPTLFRELSDSLLLAVTCGGLAILFGAWLQSSRHSPCAVRHTKDLWSSLWGCGTRRVPATLLFLLLLPGSMGNLVLGLLFAGIFQTPLLQFAYDSPVPLVMAEVCWLLPRTLILLTIVSRTQIGSAMHQLVLLKESSNTRLQQLENSLQWRLVGAIWLYVTAIVCFWSYLELMLPSILVFPGMAPISLVLYNAMHYGRISVLGVKLLITLLVPLFLFSGVVTLQNILTRTFHHGGTEARRAEKNTQP